MMDITEQLLILSFLFAVGHGVIVAQTIALNRIFYRVAGYYSAAWTLFAIAFTLGGAIRLWGLIRLPITILQAKTQGVLPVALTLEQWITISASGVVIILLIAAFDRHRRDLLKLGI